MARRDDDYDFDNLPANIDRPPMTVDVLAKYISTLKQRPKSMPDSNLAAANWWMKLQEPAIRIETPFKRNVNNTEFWVTPYTDRVLYTLTKFCNMTHADQTIVLGAFEDGVFWRGDDMDFFFGMPKNVYTETVRMREIGVSAYREEARQYVKSAISKMSKQITK